MSRTGFVFGAIALETLLSIGTIAAAPPVTLTVSGRASANVSLAARGSFVVATWSATTATGTADIYAAVSRDAGRTFSVPSRVNTVPGQANVNGEQPPRVALVPTTGGLPAIVVVWTAKGPDGTLLLTTRSDDGGRTFAPAARVPGSEAPGNRGWENVAVDAAGRVTVVWLDHRALAADGGRMAMSHHDTGHAAATGGSSDGVAMAQQSKLYYGAIAPPDLKGPPAGAGPALTPRAITGGVCYCCKTAVVPSGDRNVALAWRHVFPGNLRDIAFAISRDSGRTFEPPVRVSEDKWQLEGCPDDGPAMIADATGRFHIVWPTLVSGESQVRLKPDATDLRPKPDATDSTIGIFYSSSRDGRTFGPRVRVPTEGLAHHPQIAVTSDGGLALAWDELASGKRRVVFARATNLGAGVPAFRRELLSTLDGSVYPVVVGTPDGVLIAWTSGPSGGTGIQMARR